VSDATPKRRIEGSGSAHHGAGHWLKERVSSLLLIPLAIWGLWAGATIAGGGFERAAAWLQSPLNAAPLAALVLISLYHMQLGLRVVIEDYVHKPAGKGLLLFLNFAFCLVLAFAAVFAILKIAFKLALPGVGA
jgi:succinate dehydrogenase / fumarate reductase membrane anchor subunit